MKLKAEESERKLQTFDTYRFKFKNTVALQKHRAIWLDEIERLYHWRKTSLLDIQNHFLKFDHGDEMKWYWHREITDMSEAEGMFELKVELRDDVMELHYLSKDMHHSDKSDKVLLEKIQHQKERIQELNGKDAKKIHRLENEISKINTDPDEDGVFDEWIEYDGAIMRFRDLKYQHEDLQTYHFNESCKIGRWYEQELAKLKGLYVDIVEQPYGYLNSHIFELFAKLKEEYSHQTKEKFTMFCDRIQLEIPKLNHKDEAAAIKSELEHEKSKEQQLSKMEKRHQTLKQWREQKINQMILSFETRKVYHEEQLRKVQMVQQKEAKRRESIKFHLEQYREELEKKKVKQQELELELQERLRAEQEIQNSVPLC
ncbi:hypothetical protein HDV01_005679 [Terramyces sp. JEL0728]|nr:hypothetical protein HDV01_005679 [Terramyces sp. JEL0728]